VYAALQTARMRVPRHYEEWVVGVISETRASVRRDPSQTQDDDGPARSGARYAMLHGVTKMRADADQIEAISPAAPPPKAGGKARLLTLDGLDRRTAAYRVTRKLIDEIEGDLGGNGSLSTGERQLVQRAAVLGALLTDTESRWIEGEPIDPTAYCTVVNAQRRLFETIGLKRTPRDISPSLSDIATELELEHEQAAAE
jgi:hypothetical protein